MNMDLNQTLKYNIRSGKFSDKKEMHHVRQIFGIAYDSKRRNIYVFGGSINRNVGYALNECEKYSVSKNVWTQIRPMAKTKTDSSACIIDNKYIIVIGGEDGMHLNDIERYTIANDTWKTIKVSSSQQLTPRSGILSFQINPTSILIAGGYDDQDDEDCTDSYVYNTNKKSLKRGTNLPEGDYFWSPSTLLFKNELYVIGYKSDIIYKYDITTESWSNIYQF